MDSINVSDSLKIRKTENPIEGQQTGYVSYRKNDFERAPNIDNVNFSGEENNNKKNNAGKVIAITTAALAIGSAIYAGFHGKNILKQAEKETGIIDSVKTGYKNFFKESEIADIVLEAEKAKAEANAAREAEANAAREAKAKAEEEARKAEEARLIAEIEKNKQCQEELIEETGLNAQQFEIDNYLKSNEAKRLNDIMGSPCDYELYQKMIEMSRGMDNDPLWYINSEYDTGRVCLGLEKILTKLAEEEKDLLRKEDLLFKKYNARKYIKNENAFDCSDYSNITELNHLYNSNKEVNFARKKEVLEQYDKILNAYLGDIKLSHDITQEEKEDFVRRILSCSHYFCSDVKGEESIRDLWQYARLKSSEKFYRLAIQHAKEKNATSLCMEIIDSISKNKNISKEFIAEMNLKVDSYRILTEAIAKEIESKLSAGTIEETFSKIQKTSAYTEWISTKAERTGLSKVKILEKINNNDGDMIQDMLLHVIVELSSMESSKISVSQLETVINYISKLITKVNNEKDIELLQNIKLNAYGAIYKKSAIDEKKVYHKLITNEITDLLFKKDSTNVLSLDGCCEDINRIAQVLEEGGTYFVKEAFIHALDECLYERVNIKNFELFEKKLINMKEKFNVKTEYDYYQEFERMFNGSRWKKGSFSLKKSLDIFNKYLDNDCQLTVASNEAEIKNAYRKLAYKYHPDRASKENVEEYTENFKEISLAYQQLITKKS